MQAEASEASAASTQELQSSSSSSSEASTGSASDSASAAADIASVYSNHPGAQESPIPRSYYLTNIGQVTPVRLQSPWGDCWAFAIASAIESSILKAQAGGPDKISATNAALNGIPKLAQLENRIDLSERAIAWLAHEKQTVESAGTQAGEGYYLVDPGNLLTQLAEGSFEMVIPQFTARQSLVLESTVPYVYNGYEGSPHWYSTGAWAGASDDARMRDWSVDVNVRSTSEVGWYVSDVYMLEDPAVFERNKSTGLSTYVGYNASATRMIKQTIMDVGAVAIAIEADLAMPADANAGRYSGTGTSDHFTYDTWSQYNGNPVIDYNHAVSIVGWDDNYSASNFAGSFSGPPVSDGAWLCKNNWGSDELYSSIGSAADATNWGLRASATDGSYVPSGTEGAQASGFFWLSYYDHSIHTPVAFGVKPVDDDFEAMYQYDFLGSAEYSTPPTFDGDVWVANVFETEGIEMVKGVTAQTFGEDDTVNVAVYTLPKDVDLSQKGDGIFESAHLASEQTASFEIAGFHTIELDEPVLVMENERLIVAEQVIGKDKNSDGIPIKVSYLNLELAYTEGIEGVPMSTMATVVHNPGETFVSLGPGSWMSSDEYNRYYAATTGQIERNPDVIYGNALVKAYTNSTTMGSGEQIYKVVNLSNGTVPHKTEHVGEPMG